MPASTYDLLVTWDALDRLVTRGRKAERCIKGSRSQKLQMGEGSKTAKDLSPGNF